MLENEKKALIIIESNGKLEGGFLPLSNEKLSKIKGGANNTKTCNNSGACAHTNSGTCTNTGTCSSSTNSGWCQNR